MAIVATAQAEHACVLFATDEQETGVAFAASETFIVTPAPWPGIDLDLSRHAAVQRASLTVVIGDTESAATAGPVVVPKSRIELDPFRVAAELIAQLRNSTTVP